MTTASPDFALAADIAAYVLDFLGSEDSAEDIFPEDIRYEGYLFGDRLLGAGYARVVYNLGGGYVVKVSRDAKDNECEGYFSYLAEGTPLSRLLVKQVYLSPCGRWAIYPRVEPQGCSFGMPDGVLQGMFGVPLDDHGQGHSFCGVGDLHMSNVSTCQRVLDYGDVWSREFTAIARGTSRPTPALAAIIHTIWKEQRQAQYLETPDLSAWGLDLLGMGETRVVYRHAGYVYKLPRAHKASANVAEAELYASVQGTRLEALLVPTTLTDARGLWTVMPYVAGRPLPSWPRAQGTIAIAAGIHDTHRSNWTSEETPRLLDYGNGANADSLEEFLAN